MCATRISLGLMINAGMTGLKQEAHLRWSRDHSRVNSDEFVHCQVRANETYLEAKCQFSDRHMDVHMNAQCPISGGKLLSLRCSARVRRSFPPLVGGSGGLVCETVGKAHLLSDHFYGKQSRESIYLPLT